MAEYVYVQTQTVEPDQNVLLQDSIPCGKGYVIHRNGSGILTFRGMSNNACARFARYQATFNANIAVPTGETVGPISVAISIGGEALQASRAIVTPATVEGYFNVTSTAIIDVPIGCCYTVSIENTSDIPINVQNANLVVSRLA